MRLICPNCSAQYEIDATLVPDEGRDVQCSNCGHTWFELPPPPEDYAASAIPDSDDDDGKTDGEGEDAADTPSHAAMAIAAASEDSEDDDEVYDRSPETDADTETTAAPPPPPQQRRPADTAALGILREEAEREMSQRRAPPSEPIETQTDLGLDDIRNRKSPSRALRARMAHLNNGDDDDEKDTDRSGQGPQSRADVITDADYQAPRRDLLPDIDEINSTLNSTRKRKPKGASDVVRQQKGFRLGFLTMAILAIVLIIVYAQAPAIARAVPGSEAALIPYVDGANAIRDWIDRLLGVT